VWEGKGPCSRCEGVCPPSELKNVFAALEENVREIGAPPLLAHFEEMPRSITSTAQPVGVRCGDTGVCYAIHTGDL